MAIYKLPEMSKEEIEQVIKNQKICRIGFIDDDYPYIAPFQYLYVDSTLYFHFTDYGKKKEILMKNKNVCVSVEQLETNLKSYSFISIQGELQSVKNEQERTKVIKNLIEEAKKSFSEDFLAAHGFEKENGWDGFELKNQLIYKLTNIHNTVGLKSE